MNPKNRVFAFCVYALAGAQFSRHTLPTNTKYVSSEIRFYRTMRRLRIVPNMITEMITQPKCS